MKTPRLLFFLVLAANILSAQAQPRWRTLANSPTAPATAGRHDDVFFINPRIGWIVNGARQVYKTTDGGATWQLKFTAGGYLRSVGFADSLNGWAGGLDSNAVLYRTTDGGNIWNLVTNFSEPRPAGICGISVVNRLIVYASGRYAGSPRVIKTTNGGNSWTTIDLSAFASGLVDCYFFNADSGFVVGGKDAPYQVQKALILFTSDGGTTWTPRYSGSRLAELCWKISFPSPTLGFVSIERSNIAARFYLRTTNRGLTWEDRTFVDGIDEEGIGFINANIGWIGGWTDATYETTDGGATWHTAGFGRYINRFRFFGDTLGYAVGERVYKFSRDSTTAVAEFGQTPAQFALEQNYPNPFNPKTNIRFQVATSGFVSIKVYDLLGKEVATLVNNEMHAGEYHITFDAKDLPSGVYFYRLQGANLSDTKKMVLLR